MIRELLMSTAFAAAAMSATPTASAQPGPMVPDDPARYDTDVPGMNYDAHLTGPCTSMDRFTFGRGPNGQALQCRWIPNQWPPIYTGFWQISYELFGVQEIGSRCPKPQSAAQAPDGRPLVCLDGNWQAGKFNGVGFTPM